MEKQEDMMRLIKPHLGDMGFVKKQHLWRKEEDSEVVDAAMTIEAPG